MRCYRAVGDDGGARAGPQCCDAPAQRLQHVAADHDVIGAVAECDVDNDGGGVLQRRGHDVAPIWSGVTTGAPPQSLACSASMHSSTILSCGTSRDQIVRSAVW